MCDQSPADRLTGYMKTAGSEARGYIQRTIEKTNGVPVVVQSTDGRAGIALFDWGDGNVAVLFNDKSRHELAPARSLTVTSGNPRKLYRPTFVGGRSSLMARIGNGIKSGKTFRGR
jgi:hypothetical protein